MRSMESLPRLVYCLSMLALLGCAMTVEAVTIPSTYDGFEFPVQPAKKPVILEAFIDPMCSDCRTAWPTITAIVDLYGSSLALVIHPFPVPFHHNAFYSARALHIANRFNESLTVPFLELMFRDQESFSNDATANETPASVVQRFEHLGEEVGLSSELLAKGFLDSSTDQATRVSFKYGCSRYVTSTPSYLLNGFAIDADETWSVGQWRSILEPLLDPSLSEIVDAKLSQPVFDMAVNI